MKLGKIVGTVVSTQKDRKLEGLRFLPGPRSQHFFGRNRQFSGCGGQRGCWGRRGCAAGSRLICSADNND